MLRPAMSQLIQKNESYYTFVVAVAKRAREIAQEADENGTILIEKPVKLAVDDFAKGRYKLVESEDIGVIHDRRLMYVPSTSLEDEE